MAGTQPAAVRAVGHGCLASALYHSPTTVSEVAPPRCPVSIWSLRRGQDALIREFLIPRKPAEPPSWQKLAPRRELSTKLSAPDSSKQAKLMIVHLSSRISHYLICTHRKRDNTLMRSTLSSTLYGSRNTGERGCIIASRCVSSQK
jgi:hypothetical protein